MVADDLALRIAATHVRPYMRVLDPFCGTGRLLFAAAQTADVECTGIDVNPLANLVTIAKAGRPDLDTLRELRARVALGLPPSVRPLMLRGTRVSWLSPSVAYELAALVDELNRAALAFDELAVAAVCLSAATRDAAWIRKSGWKLHRMAEPARAAHRVSAAARFVARLDHYLQEQERSPMLGTVRTELGDGAVLTRFKAPSEQFDLIVTSPPYGDSRTTVQYGAASGICLDVVSRLGGLEDAYRRGGVIDSHCLGGTRERQPLGCNLREFWSGASDGEPARRARSFLQDYGVALSSCYTALRPGGSIVTILGRRSLGGFRLRLDQYTIAVLEGLGCKTSCSTRRLFGAKSAPRTINRFGRAAESEKREAGATLTMDSEIILTLVKPKERKRLQT